MQHDVYVVTPRDIPFQNGDHLTCYGELQKDAHIKLLDPADSPPDRIDHIFVLLTQLHLYDADEYKLLKNWLSFADTIGLICNSWPEKASSRLARELRCIVKYPKLMLRAESIGYEYAPSSIVHLSIWRRYLIGCGPHPRYFHENTICKMLYSPWNADAHRPLKLNFLGTEAPEKRAEILNDIRQYLANTSSPDIQIIDSFYSMNRGHTPLALIRATPVGRVTARPPEEYLQCLSASDFTLCIPGYTIWSCRPYDALLRGSVPILDEREKQNYLDIELIDGRNCILVYDENWPRALKLALDLNQLKIVEMRRSVQRLVESSVSLAPWSKKLMQKIGIYPRR